MSEWPAGFRVAVRGRGTTCRISPVVRSHAEVCPPLAWVDMGYDGNCWESMVLCTSGGGTDTLTSRHGREFPQRHSRFVPVGKAVDNMRTDCSMSLLSEGSCDRTGARDFPGQWPLGLIPVHCRTSRNRSTPGRYDSWFRARPPHQPRAQTVRCPAHANKFARRPVSRVLSARFRVGRPFLWDPPHGEPLATNPNGEAGMPLPRPPEGGAAAVPIRSCSRWGLPCRPCCQGRGALLPHRFALPRGSRTLARAVCFLWHCPWGRPRRRLAGTVFPWSPDFPLSREGQRPSNRLASARHGRRRAMRQAILDDSWPVPAHRQVFGEGRSPRKPGPPRPSRCAPPVRA